MGFVLEINYLVSCFLSCIIITKTLIRRKRLLKKKNLNKRNPCATDLYHALNSHLSCKMQEK